MRVSLPNDFKSPSSIAIVGHAGCGHANSHCGFVQDDSGGLATVLMILQKATGLDLKISEVVVNPGLKGCITVKTASGGSASAIPRRGLTKYEAELAQRVVGEQAVCTQALAMKAYGRIMGQGAMEVPVALQTAIANAALDSFKKNFGNQVSLVNEEIHGNCGKILGTQIMIDDIPISIMAVVNATEGGLGPNEDIEGNVNIGAKDQLMKKLGMVNLPTLLIEGKVCASPISDELLEPTFIVRAYPGQDNVSVANAYVKSGESLGYPIRYHSELLARSDAAMRDLTWQQGSRIIDLGAALRDAVSAEEKTRIAADLNQFCSQDLGGITFMSEKVHKVMGGVGMIPGTSACLSLFMPRTQLEVDVIPALTLEDVDAFSKVVMNAVPFVNAFIDEAMQEVEGGRVFIRSVTN